MTDENLIDKLQSLLGNDAVLTDEAERVFYSQDVWTRGETASAVVRPKDTGQLAAAVAAITAAGFAVIGRGGGMSYTKGYLPVRSDTVIVDTTAMDRVLDINTEDMVVTVEAGCTWKKLYEALQKTAYRTPYWGPLSGSKATVAGSISQNSIFWGSSQYGASADSVVSMDVVLADGRVLSTGSAAQQHAHPFFRHFGPDLTGIFTCDTGALGVKATVTLRLVAQRPAKDYLSFDMPDYPALLAAMSEIARADVSSECFGFDPGLTEMRAQRDRLVNDVKALAGVMKSSGSVMGAIKDGARIAMKGRGFLKDMQWPLHISVEERSKEAAAAAIREIRAIGEKHGGREVDNSIPKILRANPFGPVNNMIGPKGQRWVPVHGLVAHSKAQAITEGVEAIVEENRADLEKYEILTGYLFAVVSTNCLAIEPVFFWPDHIDELHKRSVEPEFYQKVPKHAANPEARAVVTRMRQAMVDLFSELGSSHLQVGKVYHYSQALQPEARELLQAIKQVVDPKGLVNPGSLGLA